MIWLLSKSFVISEFSVDFQISKVFNMFAVLLSISYFCIFRYINKAGFYIPTNICILMLSKLTVCSPVSCYGYTFYNADLSKNIWLTINKKNVI